MFLSIGTGVQLICRGQNGQQDDSHIAHLRMQTVDPSKPCATVIVVVCEMECLNVVSSELLIRKLTDLLERWYYMWRGMRIRL